MTQRNRQARAAAFAAAVLAAGGGSALAFASSSPLARLEPGLWQLRSLTGEAAPAPVCLGDPALLAQLRHRGLACRRNTVSQAQDRIEIRYDCPAAFGHSAIRVETPRLARIEGQGIDNGVPFEFRLEARRVGPCPAA